MSDFHEEFAADDEEAAHGIGDVDNGKPRRLSAGQGI